MRNDAREMARLAQIHTTIEGIRNLASEIVKTAVLDWRANNPKHRPKRGDGKLAAEANPCTRHFADCTCRVCLKDFFFGHPDPEPMNFRYCCGILGVRPSVVTDNLDFVPED